MTKEFANSLRKEILEENKILYCMYKRPMDETCMCWGLDVPDVWLNAISSLSKKLEAMNMLMYPKHRVRIQADQVKDKWATLHYYFSIVADPPRWVCAYEKCVDLLMSFISKLDFKLKEVVDHEPYDEIVESVIDAGKVEEAKKSYASISNVKIVDNPDGTATKKTLVHHYRQVHHEATKHKLLHKLLMSRYAVKNFIRAFIRWKPSYKQECIINLVDAFARDIICKVEDECEHLCENCGKHIGEDYSPRCMTYGWVSYLCEECADKAGGPYEKNGDMWQAGEKIKDMHQNELSKENA